MAHANGVIGHDELISLSYFGGLLNISSIKAPADIEMTSTVKFIIQVAA